MANIKSAKKRILVNRTRAARNKATRSAVKTSIKKVYAVSTISKATSKGVYHKNTSSRKIARLSKAVNALD